MKTPPPNLTKRPSSGAALIIVLAFVVLLTVLVVAFFSRTATDRQLAQSSFNVTSSDLLARSALDIVVNDLKQEITNNPTVSAANLQPQRAGDDVSVPNLIRRSFSGDTNLTIRSRASTVNSAPANPADPKRGEITSARWNSHYLIPTGSNFTAPDWVLVTSQGPNSAAAPNAVIGRYAYAVYDEGGLIDINLGGFPTYASLTRPTRRSTHRLAYPSEESEIMQVWAQAPKITSKLTDSGTVGTAYSYSIKANQNPTSYNATPLPAGLSVNTTTGVISGTPTRAGKYSIQIKATNAVGSDTQTLVLTITGAVEAASTPWPVNLARKGTVAFADLSVLPSNPAITTAQINQIMGWRNHATTQQAQTASFASPSFPMASADNYASYFLGSGPPFTTPFTTVRNDVTAAGRTDQAVMNRQELLKLQRTIGFSQNLLQYLGTFSREQNHPAPNWPQLTGSLKTARWDMNNLAIMIPDPWYRTNGNGHGHAWGLKKHSQIAQLFGLLWVDGITIDPSTGLPITRQSDRRYYGHWTYNVPGHQIGQLPANPDFFQILNYAMKQGNGGVAPDPKQVFTVGAALIDQYDTDEMDDGVTGSTITIIDYDGTNWVYGIENMSFDDPNFNQSRPWYAPYPPGPPASYVLLNRRFENVGEFGYAYNPGSTTSSKTLDFSTAAGTDAAILDFFTYNTASPRAGIVNLNTRNGPVLASIIKGVLLNDPGSENTPVALVTQPDALAAGQAIVAATTAAGGAAVNRKDVARLAAAAVAAVPALAASDETKRTIARALAEIGQTRTWNLMIDVIAQTGRYAPGTTDFTDPTKFIVQGEKRYWLHIALDRDDGTVLGQQLEEVTE